MKLMMVVCDECGQSMEDAPEPGTDLDMVRKTWLVIGENEDQCPRCQSEEQRAQEGEVAPEEAKSFLDAVSTEADKVLRKQKLAAFDKALAEVASEMKGRLQSEGLPPKAIQVALDDLYRRAGELKPAVQEGDGRTLKLALEDLEG